MTEANDPNRAADALFREVYSELHGLADRQMKQQRKDHTLQATALINEAFLRLRKSPAADACDREHFLAIAATAMRQILVDHERARRTTKRGGAAPDESFHESRIVPAEGNGDLLDLDAALRKLAALEPRKAQVVEMRVFGGMTIEETAVALGVSHMTVSTDWKLAAAWLARELANKP